MAFDITKKRATETGVIELKDADGSPLLDDDGNVLTVTVHSPASKQYQQAQAEINRKRAERMRKNGGKVEAALDNAVSDQIEFLTRITVAFSGVDHPDAKAKGLARAIYEDDALGFVRDHVYAEASDWGSFTNGLGKA